jgi:MHS family proline/betaine transporter-like MFS transporter
LPGMSQAGPKEKNITKVIVAVSIGNALEWYDISSYGYFAVYVSKAFFPNSDPAISLLFTFGTFGLAFLIRPIGGVVLGAYADRHGRKASLMISIVLMTLGTLAIAIMPTYETIGILAPIAILTARLVQGFSAGGEFGSSTAFLVEHALDRRGFIASWQFASQGLGYIRNHLEDATAPPATKHGNPVREVFLRQKLRVMLGIGALAISTAVNYLIVYMRTYVVKTLNLPPIVGFEATLAGGVVVTFLTPIAGTISDKIGRTTHMIAANLLLLFSIVPAFLVLTKNPTPAVIIIAVFWLATLKSLYYGPLAALMSELLPPATRATGLGLGYNIGVTLFGGMGPVIMTWLGGFAFIGDLSPAYYLTFVGIVSLSALITIRRTSADSNGRDEVAQPA